MQYCKRLKLYLCGSDRTNLLVDVGISAKRIESGLSRIDINPDTIQGILITHEHTDHVAGLGVMARRYHIPIYATYETVMALRRIKTLGEIPDELYNYIDPDKEFKIDDICIEPFSTSRCSGSCMLYHAY